MCGAAGSCAGPGMAGSTAKQVIAMEGNLDPEQRKRLMEIADKCPVHRTLTSEIRIVTRAAD